AVSAMDRMLTTMSDLSGRADCRGFTGDMLREELLAMTAEKARCKGQQISIDLSIVDGMTMEADYAALCRLLTNLLCNAVKYTQEGGTITLRAQLEQGYMRMGTARIRFIVADNGMGMTRTFMRRMFVPFARAKEAEQITGSGLGLSIVREMAERLNAVIRVSSAKRKGTTFSVIVPVRLSRKGLRS
ncbi:MAG: ATP-binding protein, partial [Clostridia bacterium]|nr:ATP-binding protein [Clostridia bacterium]